MLVCVREVDKSELARRHRRRIAAPHFERYYSLYTNETSATLVDVVDSRARKTFNYDVRLQSAQDLQEQVVEPLLLTVLSPDRAAQAVVVVDGLAGNRFSTLMDAVDGVLASTARAAAAHPDVASLSFSAVTLEDNNTLSDILLPDRSREAGEVTILEDTQEQFTSVEDAHYVALESESVWEAALQRVSNAFAAYQHQIFSFIFSFHPSTGRPNTTMQFVSFTVSEVARGMKSSRHAVSSAAGLIECSSPTLAFTATKLLYLLKPSLLGQQPAAWVACFSPVSVVEAAERETFQEAFAVAQTASRLYSSRIALLNASAGLSHQNFHAVHDSEQQQQQQQQRGSSLSKRSARGTTVDAAFDRLNSSGDDAPFARRPSPPPPATSYPRPPAAASKATQAAQTEPSYLQDDSMDQPAAAAHARLSHLVQTPAAAPKPRRAEAATSTPSHALDATPRRQSVGVSATAPAPALHAEAPPPVQPRESIQRGPSEEQSFVRYEFDTYRAVMERAMSKLRADLRQCVDQLAETKEEMRSHRRQTRELRRELEVASESRHATVLENSALRQELAQQREQYVQKVQELSQLSTHAGPLARREPSEGATRGLRDEVELLEVRVAELTELVAFHQSEISDHVSKESAYRQRILDLEAAVREKEREVISSRATAQEARRVAEVAAGQRAVPPTIAAAAVTEPPHSRTSSAVLREDLHDVEDRAAEVELHLRTALNELQRERAQRLQLEQLLQRREKEEVTRAAVAAGEQKTDSMVQNLQQTYEHQLRELRAEMMGFRSQLEQQMPRSAPLTQSPKEPDTSRPPTQTAHVGQPPPAASSLSPPAATLSVSNASSVRGSPSAAHSSVHEQPLPTQSPQPQAPALPPTPSQPSPLPERSGISGRGVGGGGSHQTSTPINGQREGAAAAPSQRSSARSSPAKASRRTQSFEEYMQEEPHYELHRASFLRPRPRPTA